MPGTDCHNSADSWPQIHININTLGACWAKQTYTELSLNSALGMQLTQNSLYQHHVSGPGLKGRQRGPLIQRQPT